MPVAPWVDAALAARLGAARTALDEGRWADAVALAVAEFPDVELVAICSLLGEGFGGRDLGRLFAESPEPAEPTAAGWRLRAATWLALGNPSDALPLARRAADSDPGNRIAVSLLYESAARCRSLEEADGAAEELVRIAPNWAPSYDALAETRERQGRLPEARAAAERSVSLELGRAAAWQRLGSIALAQGDVHRGVVARWAAAKLLPEQEPVQAELADALAQFEIQTARRKLPITICLLLAASLTLLVGFRFVFTMLGLPRGMALWLGVPPVLMLVPGLLSQFRRFLLRGLPPDIRAHAEEARRALGQRSGTAQLARAIGKAAFFVSYFAIVLFFEYRGDPGSFRAAVIFYALIVVLGWLRFRFAKRDTYASIRSE